MPQSYKPLRFQVLIAVSIKIMSFLQVITCTFKDGTSASDELANSIFKSRHCTLFKVYLINTYFQELILLHLLVTINLYCGMMAKRCNSSTRRGIDC
jgi:hypothetical protein